MFIYPNIPNATMTLWRSLGKNGTGHVYVILPWNTFCPSAIFSSRNFLDWVWFLSIKKSLVYFFFLICLVLFANINTHNILWQGVYSLLLLALNLAPTSFIGCLLLLEKTVNKINSVQLTDTWDAVDLYDIPHEIICLWGWARDRKQFQVEISLVYITANTDAENSLQHPCLLSVLLYTLFTSGSSTLPAPNVFEVRFTEFFILLCSCFPDCFFLLCYVLLPKFRNMTDLGRN